MTQRKIQYWVIPPKDDAAFVAAMENVLEVYARAWNAEHPVICMDEQLVQLVKDQRPPLAASSGHPQRLDYQYEHNGTASLFLFCEPLAGWRQVTARPRRTKVDWAQEVAAILDGRYAHCARITLVCDNLNTHTAAAFYNVFPASQARAYVRRIEFCYTPKHGSWLNIAESELSCVTRQCLHGRRIGELSILQAELAAWACQLNQAQRDVNWQMTVEDARIKLTSLYPKILR